MLRSSHRLLTGVGEAGERELWAKGIWTWDDLAASAKSLGFSKERRLKIQGEVHNLRHALDVGDAAFFASRLPPAEHWRLYADFRDEFAFLDIETTGLSHYYDDITVVGLYRNETFRVFVKDHNLGDLVAHLAAAPGVVTFNGSLFDLRFIKAKIADAIPPSVHLDLRFILRSLGYSGGLKKIEQTLNVRRPEELEDMTGRQAVVLWNQFLSGDSEALQKLLEYNKHDVVNLRELMDFAYNEKLKQTLQGVASHRVQTTVAGSRMSKSPYGRLRRDRPKVQMAFKNGASQLRVRLDSVEDLEIDPQRVATPRVELTALLAKMGTSRKVPLAIGIDLSGSESRPSGFCVLDGQEARLSVRFTDDDMLEEIGRLRPSVVSIDSPLSLPKGRCCASDDCECRRHGIMRVCERALKKRGVNVYPALIQSMQALTKRGMELRQKIEGMGIPVIESYPGAAQDVLQIPRKRVNLDALEESLRDLGVHVNTQEETITHDELDALTSALVGYYFLADEFEALGDASEENELIIPKVERLVHA